MANLGTEGKAKITILGFLGDASKKRWWKVRVWNCDQKPSTGRSGSQSTKIAVPLKACTAMAAEIAGASAVTEVLGQFFTTSINWENVNECINNIFKDNGTSDN